MTNATVHLLGIGRIFVDTTDKEIFLCGGTTTSGTPINLRKLKVSFNKKYHKKAAVTDAHGLYLRKVSDNTFKLSRLYD